jgi:hypothetical protein
MGNRHYATKQFQFVLSSYLILKNDNIHADR